MSERHTITETELTEWLKGKWSQFAASFGAESNKSFEVNWDAALYRVTDHQKVVYEGGDRKLAIERYNEAR